VSPGVGVRSVLGHHGLDREISRFYERRAWEANATCPLPDMEAIVRAEVIEENDDQLVALIRYVWRDDARDDDDSRLRTGGHVGIGGGHGCRGVGERRFTFDKVGDDLHVVAMSGSQRPTPLGG